MPANDPNSEPSGQSLPAGARLEEFVIEKVLGSGGFGITYLAKDTSLGRRVVIKENLPAQFAWRETVTGTVRPRHTSGGDADDFAWSMTNFLREAETLASLDHPGIVRVLRKFEANGTAYFIMPFVEGSPFDALIDSNKAKDQSFDEEGLHGLLTRMLDTLGYLHDRGVYHRDIKPANILITSEGIPVLIDFGSARQRLSERSMTVVESAGYTPFEQLQSRGNVGPWSDLYALGGTLAKAITGEAPPKANDRIRKDPHVPLAQREELTVRFSVGFLRAIDRALAVDEEARWQDAREWLKCLNEKWEDEPAAVMPVHVPVSQPLSPPPPNSATQGVTTKSMPLSPPATGRVAPMRSDETSEDQQGGGNGKSAKIWVILAGAAALVAVGVFMMISNGNKQMTSKGDRTGISTQETAAKAAQQRETERLRIDAESRDLAKLKEEAKLQQQAATEALNQARKEEAIRKQEALTLAAQQRDAKHLQEEAEAIKQAKLADAARKRQAPDPFMANDQAKPKNGDSGSPGSAPGYSTHLEFPKSEIIDRFNLGNPNNLGTALAKANTMQTKSKELARTGQEQTRTQDSISPLTGVYSSAEHIRRNGVDNIKKAEELQQDAVAIRSGVNDIKRYLQSKANEPGRTKIHEIASKDGRKMQVQIIGSVDQGIVVKKIDGEFLQVNMNQLSDKSAQYVNGIINP